MAVMFAYWLYANPDPLRKEPFYKSLESSPEAAVEAGEKLGFDWVIWPFEAGMATLILSSLLVEFVQLCVHGWEYAKDFW